MAVKVRGSRGEDVILLNPNEKGGKYAYELSHNARYTNDGHLKINKKGKALPLSDTQKAYRSGYLAACKDSARCYKANKNKTTKRK